MDRAPLFRQICLRPNPSATLQTDDAAINGSEQLVLIALAHLVHQIAIVERRSTVRVGNLLGAGGGVEALPLK